MMLKQVMCRCHLGAVSLTVLAAATAVTVGASDASARPSGRMLPLAADVREAGPVIRCALYAGQYPHFSKKYKDISWHYTWSCDDPSARAFGQSTLYYDNFPVAYQRGTQYGLRGNFNVRYSCRTGTVWSHGVATIVFSAPYHTSAVVEASSPTRKIRC